MLWYWSASSTPGVIGDTVPQQQQAGRLYKSGVCGNKGTTGPAEENKQKIHPQHFLPGNRRPKSIWPNMNNMLPQPLCIALLELMDSTAQMLMNQFTSLLHQVVTHFVVVMTLTHNVKWDQHTWCIRVWEVFALARSAVAQRKHTASNRGFIILCYVWVQ